ncbi:MAG TPA: DoxX family protein [Flavobacterium sp.]|uniref:DoxX family protein n=1 Tax=Flavobacterium sp. TaxID=239 RepID=UPI002B6CBA58|nr:DoxX family protein [Flavobacterium sp.]HNP33900.1 DoxX family protein [Flavobacterium sp.]
MDTSVKGLNKWANAHSTFWFDAGRIALGLFLIYKGGYFISNSRDFEDLIAPASNFMGGMLTFHYIAAAHIMGGIMIVCGLLTRWALLAQLPILVGAVLINFIGDMNITNFIIASVTLVASIFYTVYGSGKHSADYYFKMEK